MPNLNGKILKNTRNNTNNICYTSEIKEFISQMNKGLYGTLSLHYLSIVETLPPVQESPFWCGCITIYRFVNSKKENENYYIGHKNLYSEFVEPQTLRNIKTITLSHAKNPSCPVCCHRKRAVAC